MVTINGNKHAHQVELEKKGYKQGKSKEVVYQGRIVEEVPYTIEGETEGTVSKILHGIKNLGLTVGLAGAPIWNEETRLDTWGKSFGSERTHRHESGKKEDVAHLGYIPGNNASIVAYLKKPEIHSELIRTPEGHLYLLEKTRPDKDGNFVSRFIFVPFGDYDKATSMKFWESESGKSVTTGPQALRFIRSYCAAYKDIEDEWDKMVPKLAQQLYNKQYKSQNLSDDAKNAKLKELEELVKKLRSKVILDMQGGCAYVYADHDLNFDLYPIFGVTGVKLKLGDKTVEEINRIHGKGMKHKEPLEGDRPFKDPIPTPSSTPPASPRPSVRTPPSPVRRPPQPTPDLRDITGRGLRIEEVDDEILSDLDDPHK